MSTRQTHTKVVLQVNGRNTPFTFIGKPTAEYIEAARRAAEQQENTARAAIPEGAIDLYEINGKQYKTQQGLVKAALRIFANAELVQAHITPKIGGELHLFIAGQFAARLLVTARLIRGNYIHTVSERMLPVSSTKH